MYSKVVFILLGLFGGFAFSMNEGQLSSYYFARETYPDLSDSSSKFSKQYEQVCRRMEASNHQMLKWPDYPMMVAGKLAGSLMARKKIISPRPDNYEKYLEAQRKEMARFLFGVKLDEDKLESWKVACKTYPHLLKVNNEHTKRALGLYRQLKESNQAFFNNHEWPKRLADLTFNERLLAEGIKKVLVGKDGLTLAKRKQEKALRLDLAEMGIRLTDYPFSVDDRNLITAKTEVVRQLRETQRDIDSIQRKLNHPYSYYSFDGQKLSRQECEWKLKELLEMSQLMEQKKSVDCCDLKSKLAKRIR